MAEQQDDVYLCQHGGPGELTAAQKKLFLVTYATNLDKARKARGYALHEEILATELVVLEEVVTKDVTGTLRTLMDDDLMKLYFGMATDALLKARMDDARVYGRAGVYIAMYLKHGDRFWDMTKQDAAVQQEFLQDMYLALGKVALDSQLPQVLNKQTPCDCLEQAFPALKEKKS